ncbi:uncharacterized protein BO96DRAFT_431037 [Aspergillus niger CBS 101883]|uniref:Uncharacterized protein n=2 Tax=Aspergillus niger TaxID=5061 RepID=A2R259_ASPNC|nr:uncharacterized protein BO96DRAFT_431037 [Aspergillus niger CBS 101883]XP_059602186.1 hypothetical protein An13g03630 [Aspergillus niger]PYH59934.1 hypothetical protein BO96DRAFT_431037 [Aspergillus niger CBS 101883]CAK41759.1 hypothetical protein An13g03630 [Aspergillus niger]
MDTDRPEAYRLLAVSRSSEALEDLLHMGMLTGSRHTDFVKGASGLDNEPTKYAQQAASGSSHHGRGTHDDGIGLVAIVSPSSSLTDKHGPSILQVSGRSTTISALTLLVLTIRPGEFGCTVLRPEATSTWSAAIRMCISTRREQIGGQKRAPNRWRGMNAWQRIVRRLATSAIPGRPTNLEDRCRMHGKLKAELQGCGQQWYHWTCSMLSVPWASTECALPAPSARCP